jgi:hypothetical protein
VETPRNLVALTAEFATGVQHGEHDLRGGHVFELVVLAGRDPTPVVAHLTATVGQQPHLDASAVPCHGLVDRVVDDLVHEVVQARWTRGPDVHAGAFAHGLEAFENLNVLGAVRVSGLRHAWTFREESARVFRAGDDPRFACKIAGQRLESRPCHCTSQR